MRPLPLDRRSTILGAAIRVFAQQGYRGTSMAAIAAATDMSRPALYQYFADKEAVFRAAVAWALDGVAHDVAERSRPGDGVSVRSRVDGVLAGVMALYDGTELSRVRGEMIDETYVHAGDLWAQFEQRVLEALATALGDAGLAEPAEVAVVLLHAAEGIALKAPDRSRRNRQLTRLLDLALAGSLPSA